VSAFLQLVTDPGVRETWRPEATRDALRSVSATRRPLPERLHVLAFGARHWEVNGFWQAFEATSQLSLFEYDRDPAFSANPSVATRSRLGERFMRFVEAQERDTPAHLAFCYASGAYVDPRMLEALRARGIWTVVMALDDKQQLPGPRHADLVGWQLDVARAADLYWTTWRAGVDWLWAHGARPWYAPEAACPRLFAPRPAQRDIDVLWVGRAYGPRLSLVTGLRRRGFDVRAYGPGWETGPVTFDEMIDLYSRARIVLGMGAVGQTDRIKHLKGRDFEVPMMGAAYLTSFNPELTDHFTIGREILCYSSQEECAEIIAWGLRRPELLREIGDAARARCMREHTWERRLTDMFRLLEV
jgi:hypothetical protein